jgi:hypothetical protein
MAVVFWSIIKSERLGAPEALAVIRYPEWQVREVALVLPADPGLQRRQKHLRSGGRASWGSLNALGPWSLAAGPRKRHFLFLCFSFPICKMGISRQLLPHRMVLGMVPGTMCQLCHVALPLGGIRQAVPPAFFVLPALQACGGCPFSGFSSCLCKVRFLRT